MRILRGASRVRLPALSARTPWKGSKRCGLGTVSRELHAACSRSERLRDPYPDQHDDPTGDLQRIEMLA